MDLFIKAIMDSEKLDKTRELIDKIVKDCSENPLFLSSFTKEYMEVNKLRGWTPLILVIYNEKNPVGFVPLQIKWKLGVPIVSFMHRPILPDFVFYDEFREKGIEKIIDFVFSNFNCQLADLTLRVESSNIKSLEKIFEKKSIYFRKTPEIGDEKGRFIVNIQETWEEYIKKRGRRFRKKFRQTTRRLDDAGLWKVICVNEEKIDEKTVKKVYEIDGHSWKEDWRVQKGEDNDPYLLLLLQGAKNTQPIDSFSARVYFLELNNIPIAFAIVVQYKEVAYLIKTSYDKRYRRFNPGNFVINYAIQEMFNKNEVKKIDFITALHFTKTWMTVYKPRIKIVATKKRLIPIVINYFLSSPNLRKIYKSLQNKIPIIDFW
jgi:hypothetical protein